MASDPVTLKSRTAVSDKVRPGEVPQSRASVHDFLNRLVEDLILVNRRTAMHRVTSHPERAQMLEGQRLLFEGPEEAEGTTCSCVCRPSDPDSTGEKSTSAAKSNLSLQSDRGPQRSLRPKNRVLSSQATCFSTKRTQEFARRGPRNCQRGSIILVHDNARPHTEILTNDDVSDLNLRNREQIPYSPDAAPSDYHLLDQ
ncbi:uncharacterized protein LOC110838161 [Zootermopsis nevadensis]|uniref:uncharacterized protein LOC110838161 n=1 Tax=Zootermopsis nevadensis TaxID=136037 RepID=UPI000B8EAF58|nr:uncharacterized protein LOC110838161 [Zootermopsis nevadensis]